VNAITWTSTKFNYRTPDDHVLLRVFFGGSRRPDMMEKLDSELLPIVRSELSTLMGIESEPVLYRINRWHQGNPQYDIDHLTRVDQIEALLPAGLFLTGSAYRGIGVPDCVHQAQQTAQHVLETVNAPRFSRENR
jgi:oxygen-dependent protoporphyrinogen oxidase